MMSAEDFAAIHDGVNTMLDAVDAFKSACIERGYGASTSEQMCVHFFWMLVQGAAKSP